MTRFYEAIEEVVKNEGKDNIPAACKTINDTIKVPIIIFIDDLERVQSDVLKRLFPLIDSMHNITNLHFFVAINIEIFNKYRSSDDEVSGYFNKVFPKHIEIPELPILQVQTFVTSYLEDLTDNDNIKELVISLFRNDSNNNDEHYAAYYPLTPRTCIHSLVKLRDLLEGPLSKKARDKHDYDECRQLLLISHFFTCMQEENYELYNKIKHAKPGRYINTIRQLLDQNMLNAEEEDGGKILRPDCDNYRYLSYLRDKVGSSLDKEKNSGTWSAEQLDFVLGGMMYHTLLPSSAEIQKAYDMVARGNEPDFLKGRSQAEQHYLWRYFWGIVLESFFEIGSFSIEIDKGNLEIVITRSSAQIPVFEKVFLEALKKYMCSPKGAKVGETSVKERIAQILNVLSVDASTALLLLPNTDTPKSKELSPILYNRIQRYIRNGITNRKEVFPISSMTTVYRRMLQISRTEWPSKTPKVNIITDAGIITSLYIVCQCIIDLYNTNDSTKEECRDKINLYGIFFKAVECKWSKMQHLAIFIPKEYVHFYETFIRLSKNIRRRRGAVINMITLKKLRSLVAGIISASKK